MGRLNFLNTPLSGLKIVERKSIEDQRGFLSRLFCAEEFQPAGLIKAISQINHTLTRQKGAVRGLHYQLPPHAEIKVVNCLKGKIFDVAVDLRRDSPTFLHWHGEVLSEENQHSLLIPEGFAHGFQALTTNCELVYLHTAAYATDAERGLNILDQTLNIMWPLPISDLSDRDRNQPFINQNFQGIVA